VSTLSIKLSDMAIVTALKGYALYDDNSTDLNDRLLSAMYD